MTRTITFSEVKKHNNNESCWIVIHNDVYDVTSYLGEHPGGEQVLLEAAGTDGSLAFEDVGHSDDAREIMKKYKIGSLPPGEITTQPEAVNNNVSHPLFEGTSVTVYSQPKLELKPVCKRPSEPKIEPRVQSIVVPKERSGLKWAILALAGALVIGLVVKKYVAS